MIRCYKNVDNMWVNIKKSNFSHPTYLVRFLLHSGVIKVFYYVNNTIYSPHVYTRYMEEEKQYINDNIFKFPDLLTLEDTIVDKVNINEYVNMNLYGNILINKVTKINILFDEKLVAQLFGISPRTFLEYSYDFSPTKSWGSRKAENLL